MFMGGEEEREDGIDEISMGEEGCQEDYESWGGKRGGS